VAAPSKAWVYGLSLAAVAGSNLAWGMDVCLLLSVGCCRVEVSATGRSLLQRSPTECGVSVIEEPRSGGLGIIGLSRQEKKIKSLGDIHMKFLRQVFC
jgi:hypothetical protein